MLGAQAVDSAGIWGTRFAVWAPHARRVSVVGDFNNWDGLCAPMRLHAESGVWDLFIPHLGPGVLYKFEILGADGSLCPRKADPFAQATGQPPRSASAIPQRADWPAPNPDWIDRRNRQADLAAPLSIYQVHLGSWMRHEEGRPLTYRELADRLIPYAAGLGFTHLNLLPVCEHAFDASLGFQPLCLFSPTRRFGTPADFAHFIGRCHGAGLGVIMDWVPGHFPNDSDGLTYFDGTPLYEAADPRLAQHQDWHRLTYDFAKPEVAAFLTASARFWLERFHLDGLRLDALSTMTGQMPAHGPESPGAHFLRHLTTLLRRNNPGCLLVGDDDGNVARVTHPPGTGGLGFHYKWNTAWRDDTIRYLQAPARARGPLHAAMNFALHYSFGENFVLTLDHETASRTQGGLLGLAPGNRAERLSTLRAYLAFMFAHPGKKLLFMGTEFAQPSAWDHREGLDWPVLEDKRHRAMQRYVGELNRLYRTLPPLHRDDLGEAGFQWIVDGADGTPVFAFMRQTDRSQIICIFNFAAHGHPSWRLGVPQKGPWHVLLASEHASFAGQGSGAMVLGDAQPRPRHGFEYSLKLSLAPLSALYLSVAGPTVPTPGSAQ